MGEPSEGSDMIRFALKGSPSDSDNAELGTEAGEPGRQEGGEETAVGRARNYLIPGELYLHLIFLHLLLLFSPLVVFFFLPRMSHHGKASLEQSSLWILMAFFLSTELINIHVR